MSGLNIIKDKFAEKEESFFSLVLYILHISIILLFRMRCKERAEGCWWLRCAGIRQDSLRKNNSSIFVQVVNQYPWIALLRRKNSASDSFFCAGSVINDQWVVTAAHCLPGSSTSMSSFTFRVYNFPPRQP